ncbi:MAG: hypothetical protein FD180_860 [Planctomycetota bacterium]|nr:MAG: hypothetical protein FD180_860 [Planctomycetota bacterium]
MNEPASGHLDALRDQLREARDEGLAELAVTRGYLARVRFEEGLERHQADGQGLLAWLIQHGWLTAEEVARLRSDQGPRVTEWTLGFLALQMNLVTPEQFFECAALWLNDFDAVHLVPDHPVRDFGGLLKDIGRLAEDAMATLIAAAEAQGSADPVVDSEVRRRLLDLRPPAELREWLIRLPVRKHARPAFEPRPREERYELGNEIARGGLGRVVEALDRHLRREVAIKLVREDTHPDVAERFVREAGLAARLDHPHIIPIYDFDVMPGPSGAKRLFLCMKRVRGQNLAEVIRRVSEGDTSQGGRFSRGRLLSIFQDICLGIAYAHSKGVIHRDLKPSNVMIGDYGETLIVDWGLARPIGEAGGDGTIPESASPEMQPPLSPPGPVAEAPPDETALTLEGVVMGTPAYMPPEQATGHRDDVDRRSDIFALGGILFAILTYRPPFEGESREEVLERVKSGVPDAPSARIRSFYIAGAGLRPVPPDPVPPELDAICMKALAFRREDRYQSATDLHDDVQLFLEGVKEREREHRLADDAVVMASDAIARWKRLRGEAVAAGENVKQQEEGVRTKEEKAVLWMEEDRARGLELEAVDAFADANAALTIALGHEKRHAKARFLKAELFWDKFLEADKSGDEKEMLLSRRIVESYNDGPFDALLKGDGTLTVRTRSYACRCLLDGRTVLPHELRHFGCHPFSGRALGKDERADGLPGVEPREPVQVKVHSASCSAEPVVGADVWLWRYAEIGRLLVPVTQSGPESPARAGEPPIRAVFSADSPFYPHGPGTYLGRTPIENRALPMGSYLIILSRAGFDVIRCPVTISRCGHWVQSVTLFQPGETSADLIPVPAGRYGYQGEPGAPMVDAAKSEELDDFFISRHPVTCREYAAFLNDLSKTRPYEAAQRVPRESQTSGYYWPGPPYAVPTKNWLALAAPELKEKARQLQDSTVDWDDSWPVFGVSWEDAMAYCAWRRDTGGGLVTLPHEVEWEKAARGTDRRWFPFGKHFDEDWCNARRARLGAARPSTVQEFPHDESPYGVRGLAGNSRDHCLNEIPGFSGWRLGRGGIWTGTGFNARATRRSANPSRTVINSCGFRLARPCRLSPTP